MLFINVFREFSYGLRVRLLDAVDKDKDKVSLPCEVEPCSPTASSQSPLKEDDSLSDLRRSRIYFLSYTLLG